MTEIAPGPGFMLFAPHPIGRSGLFFWLIAVACLNSFAALAIRTLAEHGPGYAIMELGGISAIAWLALAASLALLASAQERQPPTAGDWCVAAAVLAASLVPIGTVSALALTILALHMIATSSRGSRLSRSGIICLAITATLIWGRVLLALFSRPLLELDAWLIGALFGSHQVGNVISFVDGTGRIVVAPGCSSWQGMSLALLFWVAVNQYYGVRLGGRALLTCLLALAATVAVNVMRIGAMILFPRHLEEIHHGYGWHLAVWASLIAVGTICLVGARREIIGR